VLNDSRTRLPQLGRHRVKSESEYLTGSTFCALPFQPRLALMLLTVGQLHDHRNAAEITFWCSPYIPGASQQCIDAANRRNGIEGVVMALVEAHGRGVAPVRAVAIDQISKQNIHFLPAELKPPSKSSIRSFAWSRFTSVRWASGPCFSRPAVSQKHLDRP